MTVVPAWIDTVPGISFEVEKSLLVELETQAQKNGWTVSDGEKLRHELRARTDVLFEKPASSDSIRLAVLRKSRGGAGEIRLDSSEFRTLELVYQPKKRKWRVVAGGVPIADDYETHGWNWLSDLLLKP